MTLYEPCILKDGGLGAIKMNPLSGTWEKYTLAELLEQKEELAAKICIEGQHNWVFPHEPDPFVGLDPLEGYIEYGDLETADWKRRIQNVSARILRCINTHMRFREPYAEALLANIIFMSYFREVFDVAPRIDINGMPQAGKSRALSLMAQLSYRGWHLETCGTAAVLFHIIGDFGVTPFIDEIQNIDQETRKTYDNILRLYKKSSAKISRMYPNSNGSHYDQVVFDVFTPIAYVNQSGGYIREDIVSRSLMLYMIESKDPTVPMIFDEAEIAAIRDELYTLRMIWQLHPDWINLKEIYADTIEKLQDPPPEWPRFTGRTRELASTMYTIARLQMT